MTEVMGYTLIELCPIISSKTNALLFDCVVACVADHLPHLYQQAVHAGRQRLVCAAAELTWLYC